MVADAGGLPADEGMNAGDGVAVASSIDPPEAVVALFWLIVTGVPGGGT